MSEEMKCGCGEKISQKVFDYSMEHFSRPLCFQCQKKVRDNPDWEYNPPVKEGADAKKKGTLEGYSGGEVSNPDSEEIGDIDAIGADNEAEINAELNDEFTSFRDKIGVGAMEQLYEWLKSEYEAGTFDELSIEDKRTVLEQTRQLLQQREAEKVADSKGVEVSGAKVVDAEIVGDEKEGKEERKLMKAVEIDEGEFLFQEDGDKLRCKDSKGVKYELDVTVPDCSCSEYQKDKSVLCAHLKAAAVAGYKVAKLPEKKKAKKPKTSEAKEDSVETVPERKKISIDWKNIPKQIFVPKLVKALEYCAEQKGGFYSVFKTSFDGKMHGTTLDSCDCGDFIYRGTSLNPCVHQVRIKYTDDEIQVKLKELGVSDMQALAKKPAKKETKIVPSEPRVASEMMIQGLVPRLAEVGKIKIGTLSDKIVSGRRLPKKLDHFVVTSLLRDENGYLMIDEEMANKIGNSCQELPIYLCYDDPQLNFATFFAHFTQSRLRCMGNGITASRTLESGDKEEIACNPKTCEAYQEKQCKPYGRLSVILADASRVGGCYVLRTTSWNSIRNILTSMAFIKTITGGILAGIKLKISLIPMQVQPRDMGRTVKIYTVNIEYDGNWEELKDVAAKEMQRRVQLGTNMKQIESGDREMIAEQVKAEAEEQAAEISQEFNPEEEG